MIYKNKISIYRKILIILQCTISVFSFMFGCLFLGKNSSVKEIPIIFLALKFLLGNRLENFFNLFIHNYSIAFFIYSLNFLSYGIIGLIAPISIFCIIGFSFTYANSIYYYIFIFMEFFSFIYSITSSTNSRLKIKEYGFTNCNKFIFKNLIVIMFSIFISCLFEIISMN